MLLPFFLVAQITQFYSLFSKLAILSLNIYLAIYYLTRSSAINKHLTTISDLSIDAIYSILEKSIYYSQIFTQSDTASKVFPQILKNKLIANIFFESSTRTRFSFEVAQKRLGAMVLNFDKESSSLTKGESLFDTLKTFESLGVDLAVIRHPDDRFILGLKNRFQFSIVNAGAGKFEHPTQSLLDLFTIKEEFGNFQNLTITICGDISSSRVAKSNMNAFNKLGIKVNLCGPEMLLPTEDELLPGQQLAKIDEVIADTDILMLLRIQHERHETFELNIQNYNQEYGLNHKRLRRLKPHSIIMHPGPVNRDVEISSDLVEHPQSRIFKQMQNGVYTRMAIMDWLLT